MNFAASDRTAALQHETFIGRVRPHRDGGPRKMNTCLGLFLKHEMIQLGAIIEMQFRNDIVEARAAFGRDMGLDQGGACAFSHHHQMARLYHERAVAGRGDGNQVHRFVEDDPVTNEHRQAITQKGRVQRCHGHFVQANDPAQIGLQPCRGGCHQVFQSGDQNIIGQTIERAEIGAKTPVHHDHTIGGQLSHQLVGQRGQTDRRSAIGQPKCFISQCTQVGVAPVFVHGVLVNLECHRHPLRLAGVHRSSPLQIRPDWRRPRAPDPDRAAYVRFRPASGRILKEFGIAVFFQLVRQLLAAGFHDPALGEHMHMVRHDVFQQSLIMGDDQ